MSDKYFTVVFAGNVEALPDNPFNITNPFGAVVSISAGEDLLEENERLTARVEELEGSLRDLLRLVDEDQEEDAPPYLVDQVLDRARAVITKGEREE